MDGFSPEISQNMLIGIVSRGVANRDDWRAASFLKGRARHNFVKCNFLNSLRELSFLAGSVLPNLKSLTSHRERCLVACGGKTKLK